MRTIISLALPALISGCVTRTVDVLPGVPLRITHATVTIDPDVRIKGQWVATNGKATIEPGEVVAVPLPPRSTTASK
ncbi:MAG: hypothetical protein JO353_12910 [Phycisphaerae bacterium]|nr:hypothetical protein [Phycisphaerae bacterium]